MASLVLSLLLWLYVQYQESNKIPFGFKVPIEVNPAPEGLHLVTREPMAYVMVKGTDEAIDEFKRRKRFELIKGNVNGAKVHDGEATYAVSLYPRSELANVELIERPTVSLRFEEKITMNRNVEIVPGGTLPEGFEFGSADVNPPTVVISGPKSLILGAQVQAKVSLTNVQSGATIKAKVEVLDRNGTPITEDRIERTPPEVEVTPNLTPAKPRRTLLISPTYMGRPEPGFHIVRVELSFQQVKVQGDRSKISGLTVLETEPISLAGMKGRTEREVGLKIPEGVGIQGPRRVKVTIFAEPDAVPTAPSLSPPGR